MRWQLMLMCAVALGIRLGLVATSATPGIDDSLHYYNLGQRLAEGHGFTIDYVWQYLRLYDDLTHPIDYWMPLSGVLAGGSMALLGVSVLAGALPFAVLGGLVPALVYALARLYRFDLRTSLIAAALSIALPEFVWQSTRLLTTTPQMFLVCGALAALVWGLQRGTIWAFVGGGACLGLAYLNRTDGLLVVPAIAVTLLGYGGLRWRGHVDYPARRWGYLVLSAGVALAVVAPWMLRNLAVLGQTGMVENSRIFFMVEYNDHHSFDNAQITLERLLAAQSPAQLVGVRLFELAAAIKQMIVALGDPLAIGVLAGLLLLLAQREKQAVLTITPFLILLLGVLVAYPLLIPMKSQGGSFRTAFVTLMPALIPLAAYALTRALPDVRHQAGLVLLIVGLQGFGTLDMLREQNATIAQFHAFVREIAALNETLPDVNGDGAVRLMTQDPLILSYYGHPSAIIPKGSRDEVIAAARHYRIDYIMLPTEWTELDVFHGAGASDDGRFVYTAAIDRGTTQPAEFYAILPDARP